MSRRSEVVVLPQAAEDRRDIEGGQWQPLAAVPAKNLPGA